jgi:murein DD-endopeptidase MepM/ murein hydrolase activator NlpD
MRNTVKLWMAAIGFIAMAFSLGACGTGVDPLAVAVGNGSIPQLGPISTSNFGTFLSSGFSSTTPYWTFNFTSFTGNYLSPGDGYIAQIGVTTVASQQTNFVTIVHTGGRLASRFFGVQNIVVRTGDSVVAGQPIGTFFNSSGVYFQVLLDGNPVCPLSFMSTAFRQSFSAFTLNNTCL